MLDLVLVLALSARCAPAVSPHTLAAIAHAESRFEPLAIGVNRGAQIRQPRSAPEAVAVARRLIAEGANIDLGLAQINSANLSWLGLSVEDAFDPCRNLAAAATVLRTGFRPATDAASDRQAALRVALSRYNTGDPARGFRNGYVARVEASAARLGLGAMTPDPAEIPVQLTGAAEPERAAPWDVFGRARASPVLLFSETSQPSIRSLIP